MLTGERRLRCCPLLMLTLSSVLVLSTISVSSIVSAGETTSLQVVEEKWHIYVVDEGGLSSIDVDSSCLPHVSYNGILDAALKYASWKQGAWSIQTVDDRRGSGWSSSLILDSADRPMIAYWNVPPHPDGYALGMAYWNGVNWTTEVIDNETYAYKSMGLDLGSNGLPRISFVKRVADTQMDLWFAERKPNGTWSLEMIDSGGYVAQPTLYIDSDDYYHISYADIATKELRYAYWNGTDWRIERVDSEDPAGQWSTGHWSSIKVDSDGNPHIAYEGGRRTNPLKYATKVSGLWRNTTIDYMRGAGLSMDLDSQMRPHVSYQGADLHLRLAWLNASSWETEVVDNSSYVGEFSSLRIDKADDIHISYSRLEPGNKTGIFFKYATTKELPTGGIETTVDIDPDTLNLKSRGKFITAYIELEDADVRDIDASSILLNGIISPILDEKYGFVASEESYIVDNDEDGVPERMVKFWRSEVQDILDVGLSISITVSGQLFDGTPFTGTDEIRVINTENLAKPKVFGTSHGTPLAVLPKTHGFLNVPILVHFTGLLDTDNDPQQWISSQVVEPASSSIPKMNERQQFWYRT